MEFNIEIRKKQLKSLKQYIKSSEDNVQAVLQTLGWNSKKTLEKEDPKVICPVDKNHLICYKTSEKHLEKCTLHCSGYDSNEDYLSEPPQPSKCTIKVNAAKKIEILSAAKGSKSEFKPAWNGRDSDPMTSNRLLSTFSSDERSAIYDYCIKHTEAVPKPEEFTLDIPEPKNKEELSEKEKLALERDAKRRRTKYKSVHTSKKSQTEIMREVIDNQMGLYVQWIEHKQERERREKEKSERLKNEETTHNHDKDLVKKGQQSTQYHYIETTYNQSNVSQVNQNDVQWGQSMQYSENYSNQYYGNIQVDQGIITDWSHVYQAGINSDIYADNAQYQLGGEYLEQTKTPVESTNIPYTESSEISNLNPLPQADNGNLQKSNSSNGYLNKIKNKEHSGLKVRFKRDSPEKKISYKSRSRDDRRHEKETRRYRSKERRKDKRH